MECSDSVLDDGDCGPCINQPSGICSPPSSMLLLLQRENTSHLNAASPTNQGQTEWRKEAKGQSKGETAVFGAEHEKEEGIDDTQVDDRAVGVILEQRKDRREEHDEGHDEADEVECQIIYQADGSAYILESQSQLPCSVVPSSSRPSFVNTCHFFSSQSATLKSFHVFHPKNWCHLTGDILALLTCQSKDRAPARTGSSEAELAPLGKDQPVLVCFLCHLSFSHMHAFRIHVSQHHSIRLTTEEQQLLLPQHTCAILQPVGPSNHPLLSFLEPKTSNVANQLTTTALGHNVVAMLSQEDREHLQISEPGLSLQPSLPSIPLPTSVLSPAKDPSTLGREGPQRSNDGGGSREGEERLSSGVVSTAENGVSGISSSGRQGHITEPALSNQSNPKSPNSVTVATSFMNNTKSLTDSEFECGTSFNCHGPAPVSSTVQTSSTVTTPKEFSFQESAMEIEPNNLSEMGSAMANVPNGKLYNDNVPDVTNSDLPSNDSNSQSPKVTLPLTQIAKSQLEDGQMDIGSKANVVAGGEQDFVVGRDTVQGSSYSFAGQVNMTHSRNSCKTLKCPKCNWHYKYQQTLEAHMKEKHPDSDEGQCPYCASGQNHPRLARGETYTCGYRPFRCQVCQYSTTTKGNLSIHMQSDKHLNNMQNLQSRPDAPTAQPNPLSHTHSTQTPSPSPSKVQGRASWRCEVCDYETNVARNLRIHMTSEKHTHNMLLLQQNLAHMQRQHRQNAAELYPYCQPQTRLPDPTSVIQPGGETMQESPRKPLDEDPPESLFECALCGHFSSDSLVALSQHMAMQRSLPDADWRGTTGDAHLCRLCHYATPLRANFQLHCQTDKHLQRYQLAAHLREASRHHGNLEEEEEWMLRCVAAGVQVQLRCNACGYEANSMEKLKLHSMNSRHKTSLRLYKYLQQFDGAVSDGGSLHCVLCDYSTQNSLSLVQHANSLSHQRGEGLLRLQRIQNGLQDDEEELGAIFKIRKNHAKDDGDVNEMESPAEITSDQADQTKHASREGEKMEAPMHGDKKQNEPYVSPKRSASEDTDESVPAKRPRTQDEITSEQVRQCPFCRFCHADLGRLRSHVMIQHAVQPTLRCPLCQDTLRSVALMRSHLTHLHSVTADCTQKLINAVIASDVLPEKMFLPVLDSNTQQTKADSSCNGIKRPDEQGEDEEERVTTCRPEIAKAQKQPLEDAESTKENTAAFPCWQKGCNKVLTSSSALQTHVNHFHSQRLQMPISDRHVYKYRCNQCSLAFKTAEKLQQHSQYHAIRAATMCCLCQRSFRTIQALQKHLETSHLELSEIQLQQICGSLLMTEDLLASEDQGLDEEQEEEKVKENEESDPEEKITPSESVLNLAREDAEPSPKPSAVPVRKGPNLSTEKFLDPSRPFKCTVCKESFTQKNILLVHYNSVSHLHKVKRSVQDSSAVVPESVSSSADHKPFKCSICSVAYSQSSTLEIHMRSVLHQTKARAAKLDSSVASSTSGNPVHRKVVTENAAASSATVLKPTNAMNNVSSSSSALDQTQLKHQKSNERNVVSSSQPSCHSEESEKKTAVDVIPTTNQHKLLQQQQLQQQQLVQAQAQIQQELQKKAALLQSHLFNPALLHHFSISADTLLPLQQQQQLLLPFLIPGGEFQISPELNLKGSELNLSKAKPVAPENCSEPSQQGGLISSCKQPQNEATATTNTDQSVSLTPEDNIHVPQQAGGETLTSVSLIYKGNDENSNKTETKELHQHTSQNNVDDFKAQAKDEVEDEVEDDDSEEFFTDIIPPRVAHDAPGNVSKALLENIGFELVMQFNENKQQFQRTQAEVVPNGQTKFNTKEVHHSDSDRKLECESCGKLFSNALILKSHKEHVHQSILPIQSVEKFAKDYREQYDKLFPFSTSTPVASPSLPSPASPPLPSVDPTQQKIVSCTPATTTTVTPPTVSNPQVQLAPIPLPIDLPLFPPLLMHPIPLPALPSQLPVHLPPLEAGLTSDLAQLYQQQLTPAMLQQQGKRPRTRITDDQLRVLRQYFDINNSPNEDQIQEMANKSGLPNKVIKHWFRNTLFKERQRNKDSPYNFSNPPITTLEDVKLDSRPSSPELSRQEFSGGRRSSRTRFTDFQLRVLQDFFDANAYPKDDEFEQLSNLLNLPARVIVVWFQNARQKARKSYENQGEGGKDTERREFTNDRYIRTANSSYECKKCSLAFQRIFDLISHQKKTCYKDESDEVSCLQNELLLDPKSYNPPDSSSLNPPPSSYSISNCPELSTERKPTEKEQSDPNIVSDFLTEDHEPITETSCGPEHCLESLKVEATIKQAMCPNEEKVQSCSEIRSPSPLHQQQQQQQTNPSKRLTQTSPVPSQSSQVSSASPAQHQHLNQVQQMAPYHCIQCKLSFPSFEHWQEHQQMHFLVAQNHFVPPQFLDRTMDIPLMLFDSANPLVARQVLSGTFPQISLNSPIAAAISDSAINSLKRRLEPKSGNSALENDWEHSGDDSQRDKRMRTTITPEQLEILYQKYLLDSNPTRQMLDHISQEVGLKKRVVQVWFQNTRARERKGQFRGLGPAQAHRRCPFCRALFKAQTALDAHIRSRHWHEAKNAGFSMAVAAMTQDQESSQMKMDLLNFSNSSQMPNPSDGLNGPDSPTCKSVDLSLQDQGPSPKPLICGGVNDLDSSSTSIQQSFECGTLDSHKGTSVHMVPNGTITDEENYSEGKQNSIDHLSCSSEREASSESEDKMSSGLVSPAMSFNAKDYENDLVLDYSENSSLADPASPCPGGSNSQNIDSDRPGQKRYRTQLSNLQVKVLKACFSDYKTPTMLECEALGNDIGLPKRVVQVWFQNARAKEKKAKLSLAKQFGTESTCTERPKTECTLCSVKYSGRLSVRDHVFSQQHLAKVKEALGGQIDRDREYADFASVRHLMTEQETNNLKKGNEITGVAQTQSMESSAASCHTTPQYSNLQTSASDGTCSKSLSSSSATKSDTIDVLLNGLISKPSTSSSSSMSTASDKTPVGINNSVSPIKPIVSELQLQLSKENNSDKGMNPSEKRERACADSAAHSNSSISKEKQDSSTPAASAQKPVQDCTLDPGQLQTLQAAGNIDQTSLLSNPLLPCLMPGFPPMFSPQIPTALTGSFLQPMFGMDSMFQYSPVLPQALMGLSPGSILQQYQHNLQGALMHHRLQLQKKQLLQQTQKPKASQTSATPYSQDMAYKKDLVLNLSKPEEKQASSDGEASSSGTPKQLDDSFLVSQCILSKGTSREGGKDICLYDCLACEISLNGNEELTQHLENRQHRQRAVEHLNAKEHASRLLPHVCPSSTSQPNPPSNPISPSKSPPKPSASDSSSAISCQSRPTDQHSQTPSTSTALSGAAQSSCAPASSSVQVSLHSTVTSCLNGNVISLKPTDSASGCYTNDGAAE